MSLSSSTVRPLTSCLLTVLLLCCWKGDVLGNVNTKRPNIIYILADDLGIGDVRAFNPEGKVATPSMDRLAAAGMRFTDAHSGSAVCTPTRYGVLTGRYSWRTRLQSGVCWGYSTPLIANGRMTVASLLKQQGYNTGCVGKWHLGLKWALKDSTKTPSDSSKEPWDNIDFSKPISSGPNQVGFDYFFGISASLDMHPHVYIENDRVTRVPEKIATASGGKKFWREGPLADDFKHVEVLDKLTEKAVEFIREQSQDKPFFLYFPLTAPHKPIIPTDKFLNKSGLNEWGDFVMQVDWTIGEVMKAVESQGLTENTLFIVTSDNGATPGADFVTLGKKGHDPSYHFRGHKADIFEGGHRVAFIASWPAVIEAGSESRATICHTDLLATVAEITGGQLPADAGEDSVSLLPLMSQTAKGDVREATVHHSVNGSFAIRSGKWKLCFCPGSGGWSDPRPPKARRDKLPEVQLFDLSQDIGEANNLQAKHPEVVEKLTALLRKYVDQGRSTPGDRQTNDERVRTIPTAPKKDSPRGVSIQGSDGKAIIQGDDIQSYEWKSHTLTLKPDLIIKLHERLQSTLVSGHPFQFVVDGKVIYEGTLTTINSSYSFATPVIAFDDHKLDKTLKKNQLRIKLGYPKEEFFRGKDKRGDKRIKQALKEAGKLKPAGSKKKAAG